MVLPMPTVECYDDWQHDGLKPSLPQTFLRHWARYKRTVIKIRIRLCHAIRRHKSIWYRLHHTSNLRWNLTQDLFKSKGWKGEYFKYFYSSLLVFFLFITMAVYIPASERQHWCQTCFLQCLRTSQQWKDSIGAKLVSYNDSVHPGSGKIALVSNLFLTMTVYIPAMER